MNLSSRLSCIVASAAFCLSAYSGEADAELKVQANGLRVAARPASDDEALKPFSALGGTTVALLISSEKGGLIQFDPENSAISRFTDDKGNDLLTSTVIDKSAGRAGFSMFPKVSADGKYCAIEVSAYSTPAKGSTKLKLEGVATMLCASEKTETVAKNVAIKNTTKFEAAGIEFALDNVGKPDFGDDPFSVTLRSHNKLDNVAEIKFCKADGTEIKSHRTGSSKMAILGSLTVEWTYGLDEKTDLALIKVFVWKDMEKKKVPFKLDVDVGL